MDMYATDTEWDLGVCISGKLPRPGDINLLPSFACNRRFFPSQADCPLPSLEEWAIGQIDLLPVESGESRRS